MARGSSAALRADTSALRALVRRPVLAGALWGTRALRAAAFARLRAVHGARATAAARAVVAAEAAAAAARRLADSLERYAHGGKGFPGGVVREVLCVVDGLKTSGRVRVGFVKAAVLAAMHEVFVAVKRGKGVRRAVAEAMAWFEEGGPADPADMDDIEDEAEDEEDDEAVYAALRKVMVEREKGKKVLIEMARQLKDDRGVVKAASLMSRHENRYPVADLAAELRRCASLLEGKIVSVPISEAMEEDDLEVEEEDEVEVEEEDEVEVEEEDEVEVEEEDELEVEEEEEDEADMPSASEKARASRTRHGVACPSPGKSVSAHRSPAGSGKKTRAARFVRAGPSGPGVPIDDGGVHQEEEASPDYVASDDREDDGKGNRRGRQSRRIRQIMEDLENVDEKAFPGTDDEAAGDEDRGNECAIPALLNWSRRAEAARDAKVAVDADGDDGADDDEEDEDVKEDTDRDGGHDKMADITADAIEDDDDDDDEDEDRGGKDGDLAARSPPPRKRSRYQPREDARQASPMTISPLESSDDSDADGTLREQKQKRSLLKKKHKLSLTLPPLDSPRDGNNGRRRRSEVGPRKSAGGNKGGRFSERETEQLLEGLRKFGWGEWAAILRTYQWDLPRTNVNLKDRARTMSLDKTNFPLPAIKDPSFRSRRGPAANFSRPKSSAPPRRSPRRRSNPGVEPIEDSDNENDSLDVSDSDDGVEKEAQDGDGEEQQDEDGDEEEGDEDNSAEETGIDDGKDA